MRRPAAMVVAKRVQPVTNLREFFRDALHGALEKQQLAVEDQTEHYVVNVLTMFARSEALYEQTADGVRLKPLVVMLCEALEASGHAERNRSLQRLGDVSLFVAGFFARAYGALAHTLQGRGRVLAGVFAELSEKFQPMVDALNDISESGYLHSDQDI